MVAAGLMCGTSLDGIDAALVHIQPRGASYSIELLNFATLPLRAEIAEALRMALPPHSAGVAEVAALHRHLGVEFANAAKSVLGDHRPAYIASHGVTLWHDGPASRTLQIGDAFAIRAELDATVCYDFRSGDCAEGGQGAPLVPYVDALLVADAVEDRVAVNIGGIANITALPHCCSVHDVLAFDTGPGNMLIDAFVRDRTRGVQTFDVAGAFARAGCIDVPLLDALLADPYFAQTPPKSTGRERFGEQALAQHAASFATLSLPDGCATLTELTAVTIADAVASLGLDRAHLLVSGGGAHNTFLGERLRARLPRANVESSDVVGINIDAKEAIAFAVLGYETLRGRSANLPRVTGAARRSVLGAIAPYELHRLLAEVEHECRAS